MMINIKHFCALVLDFVEPTQNRRREITEHRLFTSKNTKEEDWVRSVDWLAHFSCSCKVYMSFCLCLSPIVSPCSYVYPVSFEVFVGWFMSVWVTRHAK